MLLTLHFSVVNNLSSQSKTTHILFEMCAEFFPEMKKVRIPFDIGSYTERFKLFKLGKFQQDKSRFDPFQNLYCKLHCN